LKNTKLLVCFGLIALIGLSWYSLMRSGIEPENEYNAALEKARTKAQMGIYVDADEEYEKALELHNTIELNKEILDYYKSTEQFDKEVRFAERVTSKYPTNVIGYEHLAERHIANNNYEGFYDVKKVMDSRHLKSENVDTLAEKVKYAFQMEDKGYQKVLNGRDGSWTYELDGFWGYGNAKGASRMKAQYAQANPFGVEDFASVKTTEGEYILINKNGDKKYIDLEKKNIEECGPYMNGFMYAKIDGTYKYLDKEFKVVLDGYEDAGTFNYDIAPVKKDGKWMLINPKGEQIGTETYDDIWLDEMRVAYRNGVIFVREGQKIYMVGPDGNKIIDKGFDNASVFLDGTYAAVCENNKWGFVDNTGNIVIDMQYDEARSFSHGLAAVKINGKWGFIDDQNIVQIPATFADVKYFTEEGTVYVTNISGDTENWELLSLYRY